MQNVRKDWGQVSIDQASDGSIQATFENETMICQYGLMECGTEEAFESPIRRLVIKSCGEDQVQAPGGDADSRIDASAYRGSLTKALVIGETKNSITARLTWIPLKGPIAEQEVTIFNDLPGIQIRHLTWFVNMVDIAHPGGTNQGEYYIYGAEQWHRDYTFWENIYFCKYPGDINYMNITEVEDPTPLLYKGHFIMGVYNPTNGHGYGRVAPAEPVDIIKLLFQERPCGFELFPCYNREHHPFNTYIFPFEGAKKGVLRIGKQIVDRMAGI